MAKNFFVEWNSWHGREIRGFETIEQAWAFAFELTRGNPNAGALDIKIS